MDVRLDEPRPAERHHAMPVAPMLGLPSGWFVVATSAELPRGRTLTTWFMSEQLVLYRTASGQARAISPYCPHMGAHLGHCGTVLGESLRCDFHHFQFDGAGACIKTGYGSRPPSAARLSVHPLHEQHGVILVYHDPAGRPPPWRVPELPLERWSPIVMQKFSVRGHPQETTENGVDMGHFSRVHGYRNVRLLRDPRTAGPYFNTRYAMTRGLGPTSLGVEFHTEFEVHIHGLGYSLVDVDVKSHGFRTRQFVFATPTEPGWIDLRLGVSVEESRATGRLAMLLPRRRIAFALARFVSFLYKRDVGQDFRIWEHKRYLAHPALAVGDGPVGLYRKWASQFYPAGG